MTPDDLIRNKIKLSLEKLPNTFGFFNQEPKKDEAKADNKPKGLSLDHLGGFSLGGKPGPLNSLAPKSGDLTSKLAGLETPGSEKKNDAPTTTEQPIAEPVPVAPAPVAASTTPAAPVTPVEQATVATSPKPESTPVATPEPEVVEPAKKEQVETKTVAPAKKAPLKKTSKPITKKSPVNKTTKRK
jgi:hypothetical protein